MENNNVFMEVMRTADKIQNQRTPHDILAHLMSEVGELAEEVAIDSGFLKKKAGADGILGEAIDVIICAIDLVAIANNQDRDVLVEQMHSALTAKCAKWERVYGKQS